MGPVETGEDLDVAATHGGAMPPNEVVRLEKMIQSGQAGAHERALLAGFYFLHTQERGIRAKRRALILWFIKTNPRAPSLGSPYFSINEEQDSTGYQQARAAWGKLAARTTDLAILQNAAGFFRFTDPPRAIRYLERAERLQPSERSWKRTLGAIWHARASQLGPRRSRRAAARRALLYFEAAHRLTDGPLFKWYLLAKLAETSLLAGDLSRARAYAARLLKGAPSFPTDWNYGNAIHNGNEVLGQVSLRRGNRKKALEHLAAAGATPGSPQLNSFGPSFRLAQALLDAGERDAVLAYLESCARFWRLGQRELATWTVALRSGHEPNLLDRNQSSRNKA